MSSNNRENVSPLSAEPKGNMATAKIHAGSWCFTKSKLLNFSHIWTIDNISFYLNSHGEDYLHEENPFGCDDQFRLDNDQPILWALQLCLRNEDHPDFICLKINPINSPLSKDKVFKARFSFSILDEDDNKLYTKSNDKIHRLNATKPNSSCITQFITLEQLQDKTKGYLVDDQLKIFCEIQVLVDLALIAGPNHRGRKLHIENIEKEFGNLFESKELCDVTLVVGEEYCQKEIHAHKVILGARSPVFAAMFRHEMEEKNANRVEITDIEADVLEELLRYIYTGQTRALDTYAADLLVAGDKYGLEQLKIICEEWLCSYFTTESVSQILILADACSASHLKVNAIEYIRKHPIKVLSTTGWKEIIDNKPNLVIDVFKQK